jgi:DNA-binding GntR family transcriptional regulator
VTADLRVRGRGPAPSNVDVAVDALRDAILDGRLKPGQRLKEIPLAERLGVSRGPIRDALRLLERDGLIEVIPNRGAVVPEVHALDVLEVYALRASLGSLALQKSMLEDRFPDDDLERALKRLRTAVAHADPRRAAEADLAYQSAIIAGSGLLRVTREFERLTWQVRSFMTGLAISYEDKLPRILAEVEALHAAIAARNAVEAETLWREKYERWVRNLVELLPETFDEQLWTALTSGRRG